MEEIQHKYVQVGGLNIHVAEIGTGTKVVMFLHGFPEIWYSWRHQMVALAKEGEYRAVAIDYRGYGLSDQPPEPEKTTQINFAEDVIGVLDSLGIHKAFFVGKDFGCMILSLVAVLYPERLCGFITLGGPFMLPGRSGLLDQLPKGFYVPRWQEPGRAEADFGRFDVKTVIRKIYVMFCWSELQVASDDQEIMDLVPSNTPLPPWFSEEDLSVYANLYEKSGFRTPLQVPYRTLNTASINIENPKVTAPALLIMGEQDYCLKFPGIEDYIRSGMVKKFVPNLEMVFLPQGNHFVQEQLPEQVNQLIISFLNKQTKSTIQ